METPSQSYGALPAAGERAPP